MRQSDKYAALNEELARFQDEIRQLAFSLARSVVREELERRLARLAPRPAISSTRSDGEPAAPAVSAPISSVTPAGRKGRTAWTRDAIINELASWMASGTSIDAAFVKRYGPPGLVAATRRVFGRFDAALNVAGLHFSKLYPDGPPERGEGR